MDIIEYKRGLPQNIKKYNVKVINKDVLEDKLKTPVGKENKIKKRKVRCSFCNTKCDLMNFTCECGGKFCMKHRYTHMHNCTCKDAKINNVKKSLEDHNPKVSNDKVVKI